MNQMQFLGDKVIEQEVTLDLLINALSKLYPEVTKELITGLDHVLKTSPIPTPGARKNLESRRAAVAGQQPTQAAGH